MTGTVGFSVEDRVATVTLSNPGHRNAIDRAMYDRLEAVLDEVAGDEAIVALVIRGTDGAFAGGTDIRWLEEITSGEAGVAYEAHMRRVQEAFLALDVPLISVVDGPCVGGGLVFAALSDIVLCTPSSRFGSPIARTIGNTLSPTSIARLSATFGRRNTAEMLFTARLFDAHEAHRAGFVNDVCEPDDLEVRVRATLDAIRACAPLTLRSFRRLWRRIDAAGAGVGAEDVYAEVYASADFAEGVRAFLAKRPARYEGR